MYTIIYTRNFAIELTLKELFSFFFFCFALCAHQFSFPSSPGAFSQSRDCIQRSQTRENEIQNKTKFESEV